MRLYVALLCASSCTLTPIPDVSSNWVAPCDTALRVCPLAFSKKTGMEQSVELRGSFRDGGWQAGIPMDRVQDAWTTTLQVPWGASVQYKFFVDGQRWELDPANTQTVPDGAGNTNSIVRDVTCAKWTCRQAQ
jgi:hypothetical protein